MDLSSLRLPDVHSVIVLVSDDVKSVGGDDVIVSVYSMVIGQC